MNVDPSSNKSYYNGDALSVEGSWYAGLWAEPLPDGRAGAMAHVWRIDTLEKVSEFVVLTDSLRPVASSSALDLLLSADFRQGVAMYRVSTGEELVRIDDSYVGRVTILNEELFAIVRQSSALDVHSLANGEFVDTIKGVDKPLVPAQVDGRSPARMLASGIRGGDYRILTCDLALGSARLAKHLHVPTAWAYHLSEPIAIVSEYPNCVRCISLDPLEVIWQKLEVGFVLAFAFGAQDHAFYMLTMTEDQEYGTIVRVDAATGTTEPVSHAIHKPAYSLLVPDPLMLIGHDGRVHRYVGGWFQEYARLRIGPAPLI